MKKKGLLGILLAFVIVMTSAISTNAATTAEVSATALNVRSGKGTAYSVVRVLHKGDTVEVLDSSGEWYKISYNGVVGYASSKYLVKAGNSNNNNIITVAKTGTVTASSLNVRSGPGTYYSKIGSLKKGATVQIVSQTNGWYKIYYKNGTGYISAQYIRILSNTQKQEPNNTTLKQNEGLVLVTMNVRSGPATSYSRIGSVSKNTKVRVISQQNGWYKIYYKNGTGYVSATYLKRSWDNSKYVICVNIQKNYLNLYDNSNGSLVKSYRCATGKSSTPTPRGVTTIYNKIVNRPYYKEGIPGGDPRNPLGNRWLGLNINETKGQVYAIHGNNNENSIGKHVSAGCIRMHNSDVKELYNIVPIGTKVVIQK